MSLPRPAYRITGAFQQELFPRLESELGPTALTFVAVLELVPLFCRGQDPEEDIAKA